MQPPHNFANFPLNEIFCAAVNVGFAGCRRSKLQVGPTTALGRKSAALYLGISIIAVLSLSDSFFHSTSASPQPPEPRHKNNQTNPEGNFSGNQLILEKKYN